MSWGCGTYYFRVKVSCSIDGMEESFNDRTNGVLVDFIEKYSKELGHPEVGNLIKTNNPTQSLIDVLVSTVLSFIM